MKGPPARPQRVSCQGLASDRRRRPPHSEVAATPRSGNKNCRSLEAPLHPGTQELPSRHPCRATTLPLRAVPPRSCCSLASFRLAGRNVAWKQRRALCARHAAISLAACARLLAPTASPTTLTPSMRCSSMCLPRVSDPPAPTAVQPRLATFHAPTATSSKATPPSANAFACSPNPPRARSLASSSFISLPTRPGSREPSGSCFRGGPEPHQRAQRRPDACLGLRASTEHERPAEMREGHSVNCRQVFALVPLAP